MPHPVYDMEQFKTIINTVALPNVLYDQLNGISHKAHKYNPPNLQTQQKFPDSMYSIKMGR